jgi:hypothetical protein
MWRARGDGSHGFGIYVSPLDCIPADYTNVSATRKDGIPNQKTTTFQSTGTSSSAYQTANGALEFYHLGSGRNNYLPHPIQKQHLQCSRSDPVSDPRHGDDKVGDWEGMNGVSDRLWGTWGCGLVVGIRSVICICVYH